MRPPNAVILLVEDEPNDQLLIERAFRKAQVQVPLRMVSDGEEAIAYLSGHGQFADRDAHPLPSMVLLDLKLPRVSGFEVLEWLRQQPRLRRLPVVVLTSSREKVDIDRAYDLGVNSFLAKPVDFSVLIEMVAAFGAYWLGYNQRPDIGVP